MEKASILLGTLFAAFLGSIIGPFIIYKYKKKYDAFIAAVRAFTYYHNEATNNNSSGKTPTSDDLSGYTKGLIMKANDLVFVHFSEKAYNLFDKAIKAKVSRDNAPNSDFFNKKEIAIKIM